jgi:CheY-like chemotaxis protein
MDRPTPRVTTSGTHRRPGRVLVIDDWPLFGRAIQRALCDEHEVVVVMDGPEALQRLTAGDRYDVVLCDLTMPTMDGIDFYLRLADVSPKEAGRVVFVTGGTMTPRTESFFRQSSNLLLEKPIDVDGLRALIGRRMRGVGDGAVGLRSRDTG